MKKGNDHESALLKRGAWCGITLGTSAGVAGFAAVPLALAVNWLGDTVYRAVPEESSQAAGACVLVVLGGVVVAIVFAIDEAAGVLFVVVAATLALWR